MKNYFRRLAFLVLLVFLVFCSGWAQTNDNTGEAKGTTIEDYYPLVLNKMVNKLFSDGTFLTQKFVKIEKHKGYKLVTIKTPSPLLFYTTYFISKNQVIIIKMRTPSHPEMDFDYTDNLQNVTYVWVLPGTLSNDTWYSSHGAKCRAYFGSASTKKKTYNDCVIVEQISNPDEQGKVLISRD